MSRLVIFDIDGKLVPGASSEVRFARYLWRNGYIGLRQLLAFAWFSLRYFPRYPHNVMQKNKAYLSGLPLAKISALAADFVQQELMTVLYRPTLLRLCSHQVANEDVTLLSGTPQFLADALAQALGVEHSIGALCDLQDGCFTSAPPQTHPHGPDKCVAAQQLAEATGLPLSQAIAYGDSEHDAWLFRRVATGVAVMPDRGLRSAAAGEGWEIFG